MELSLTVARRAIGCLVVLLVSASTFVGSPVWAVDGEGADPFGSGALTGDVKRDRVEQDFFGLQINLGRSGSDPWPDLVPKSVRLNTYWKDIETSPGTYNWAGTDARVAAAERNGAKPLLDLLATPTFHALEPNTPLFASPPRLSAYRHFAQALVSRYGTRVDYQVWNEPNVPNFYTGTPKRMARMTKHLAAIVRTTAPGATVVAPSFPLRVTSNRRWFRRYWTQSLGNKKVGSFVDAASISAYPMPDGDPEDALAITQWARKVIARQGYRGPLWATEINYGANSGYPTKEIPVRREVSNVTRTFVLHASLGADRVYWWMWAPNITVNTELQDGYGVLTPAGIAFGVVRKWLTGTRPTGCATTRGVTTCEFRVSRDLERYVSWNRWGKTRTMIAPPGARSRTDSRGRETVVQAGERLRVSLLPTMLEVRRVGAVSKKG